MKYIISIFFLIHIHILYADLTSSIDLYRNGFDFIPANEIEYIRTDSSVISEFTCSLLCHQDPQCRTFVFDEPVCQLYEGVLNTGSLVAVASTSRTVGEIKYDNIDVMYGYNKSCDHCFPDRYLVCRNNTCQCPVDTFYDNQGNCRNQLYVDSKMTCENDNWCNQNLNLTCQCGKCQCPSKTFWKNKTCIPQYLAGISCNTSDQCRNDLKLICSRQNKTCIPMTVLKIPVIDAILPAKFSNFDMSFNSSGEEWWRAFDNSIYTYWNRYGNDHVLDYVFFTFNDTYLLDSLQLTVVGDVTHDPKIIDVYIDENGTCFGQSFSFPQATSNFYTFPSSNFNTSVKPLATNHVLLVIERWSMFQTYIAELTFSGGLY
ncbi:hypothetical protein I4U23_016829 [Adineta vaga]|nr:hypothetical protein I4U23_016829 [Adineta vaga]